MNADAAKMRKKKLHAFFLGLVSAFFLLLLLLFILALVPRPKWKDFSDAPGEYKKGHGPHAIIPQKPRALAPNEKNHGEPFNPYFERNITEGRPMEWDFTLDGTLYLPLPGTYFIKQKTVAEKPVFTASYEIDAANRRITPFAKEKAAQFLLLLGDSYTFGWGVNQKETYAAHLAKSLQGFQVYNYGVPSLFPGEALLRLDRIKKANEVTQKSGAVLFFYGSYSVFRNMGEAHDIGHLGEKKPYLKENENGEFVFHGNYLGARPLWLFFSQLLVKLQIERHFRVILRREPTDADWQYEARLLQKMKEKSAAIGATKFFVVLYPGPSPGLRARHAAKITAALEAAKIDYIDFSDWNLGDYTKNSPLIFNDGHYTPEAHAVFARALDLVLREKLN
jgi:hypothetical protein